MNMKNVLDFFEELVNKSPTDTRTYTIAGIGTLCLSIIVSIIVFAIIFISILLRLGTYKIHPLLHSDTVNGWYIHNVFNYMEIIISSVGLFGLLGLVWVFFNYKMITKVTDIDTVVWLVVVCVIIKWTMDVWKTSSFNYTFKEYHEATQSIKDNLYGNLDIELFKKLRSVSTGRKEIVKNHNSDNILSSNITTTFLAYLENTKVPSKTIDYIEDGIEVDPITYITSSTFNILEKIDGDNMYSAEYNNLYENIANNVQKIILITKTANVFPIYMFEFLLFVTLLSSTMSKKLSS